MVFVEILPDGGGLSPSCPEHYKCSTLLGQLDVGVNSWSKLVLMYM